MDGKAVAMALDVGAPTAMDDLAALAVETFGGIDVWVEQRRPVLGRTGPRTRRTTPSSASCRST